MEHTRRRRHVPRRRPTAVVVTVSQLLVAALSASLLVYIGYLWSTVHDLNTKVSRVSIEALDRPAAVDPHTGKPEAVFDGQDENILVVGDDDRAGLSPAMVRKLQVGYADGGSDSTDVMMILHVPANGTRATMISLPRDSYVDIPGFEPNKLNAAFADGYGASSGTVQQKTAAGADLLTRTVDNLTGLHIDHYVQIGFLGFYRLAQAVHGIPVTLCDDVDDSAAYNFAHGQQNGGSGFKMSKGYHVLNAVQSLEFVRQRHWLAQGDIERVERQRYLLTAAFRKIASARILLDPTALSNLVTAIHDSIYIDQNLNILDLAKQVANLSANNISGTTIPIVGNIVTPAGQSLEVSPPEVRSFVRSIILGPTVAYQHAGTVQPSTVDVAVVNASLQPDLASPAVRALTTAGFHASADGGVDAQGITTITYPAGDEAQAKTLSKYVPSARVIQADVSQVTLTLATDDAAVDSAIVQHPRAARPIDSGCVY